MAHSAKLGTAKLGDAVLGSAGSSSNPPIDQNVGNSYSPSHAVDLNKVIQLSASNSISYSQALLKVLTEHVSNTITFIHSVGSQQGKFGSNTITFTATLDYLKTVAKSVLAEITFAQSLTRQATYNRSLTSTLSLSQTLGVHYIKPASNTLVLSQTLTVVKAYHPVSNLDLGHALVPQWLFSRDVPGYFPYYHTLSATKTLNIAVGNTLNLVETLVSARVKGGENTLVLSQAVAVTNSKAAKNTLAYSQNAVISKEYNISVTQKLKLTSSIIRNFSKVIRVRSGFGMNNFVKKWKQFDLSPSNVLTLTQSECRERFNRSVVSSLALSQDVEYLKIISRNVHQVLSLTQAMVNNAVIKRSLGNTLIYLPEHLVYVPIGDMGVVPIPNVIVTKIKLYKPPSSFQYYSDGTNAVFNFGQSRKRVKPYCVLQVPERAITLPAPEFGDTEGYGGLFTIRRSMVGGTVTYVHRLDTSVLKYNFELGLPKAQELEDYLINFNSRVHYLTNWKGELWYVFITNNPLDLISRSRYENETEKILVTLDFEGKRIN
jgi:hypothetical protein